MEEKEIKICDYGCGRKAKFQLKNGKWCCKKFHQKCPTMKKKYSKGSRGICSGKEHYMYGKHLSEEIKKKISIGNKGKIISEKQKTAISKANKERKLSKETKKKISEAQLGKKSFWFGKHHTEETKKKMSKVQKEFYKNHPEKVEKLSMRMRNGGSEYMRSCIDMKKFKKQLREEMLNGKAAYISSCNKNPSKPQVELFEMVKEELYPNTVTLNFLVKKVNRSIDIAIPLLKIAIEYDCWYWHQDKEADDKRQKELEDLGWRFIRYKDYVPIKNELLKDIRNVLS